MGAQFIDNFIHKFTESSSKTTNLNLMILKDAIKQDIEYANKTQCCGGHMKL